MSTYVPFDIQVRILQQRLPMKSLIRFISVCKAWKSLIITAEFLSAYGYRHKGPEHLMIRYEVGETYPEEVKFICFADDDTFPQQKFAPTVLPPLLRLLHDPYIIDSCCGLLCLDVLFVKPGCSSGKLMVVLWNPLIRKSIAIDLPSVGLSPFRSVVGFGVCPQTNDPKLVQITYIDDGDKIESISCIPNQVMVFTLRSREWRCLSSNHLPRKSIEFDQRCTRVIGRSIYWLAYDRTVEDDRFRYLNSMIMSFDLSTEKFREIIHLPDNFTPYDEPGSLHLFRLKESLAVVEFNVYRPLKPCVVWMMEHEDPKSFTKLFTIEAPHASIKRILGFSNSGEPLFESLEADHQDSDEEVCQLVVYEPYSRHIKHLGVRGNSYSFSAISYTESLLLLDHDDGCIISCGDVKRVGTGLSR